MEARAKAEAEAEATRRTVEPERHAEADEVTQSIPEPDEVQDVEPEPVETGTQRCSRCNRVLSVTEFHRTVRHGVSTYRRACKKCRGEPMPQFIPDRSREAVEGRDDPAPKPRPVGDSGPGITYPASEPLPDPPPASSPAPPRYLREAEQRTRLQVIRSLGEMSWEERQEELRIPRIYPSRRPRDV